MPAQTVYHHYLLNTSPAMLEKIIGNFILQGIAASEHKRKEARRFSSFRIVQELQEYLEQQSGAWAKQSLRIARLHPPETVHAIFQKKFDEICR